MIGKVLSAAACVGLLLAISAPVSFAQDAAPPKTKAECKKAKGTWDATKKSALFRSKVVFKVIRRRWAESLPPFFNSKLSLHVRFDAALCRAQRTGSSQRLNMILFDTASQS